MFVRAASQPASSSSVQTLKAKSRYPAPLIVEASGEHRQSWIVLHGRGDTAESFAKGHLGFLNIPFPDSEKTIQDHLPETRFIFPTASLRESRLFKDMDLTQWFDIFSWNSTEHSDWQIEGLRETSAWIHELMYTEIEAVGAQNVVVGGLSQGCASVLITLLLWPGESIKAAFGMSGWLPFQHILEKARPTELEADGDTVSKHSEIEGTTGGVVRGNLYQNAVDLLCQKLQVEVIQSNHTKQIPIFITHGGRDDMVDVTLGRRAADVLKTLGCEIQYQEYPTLVHWMRGDELSDIVNSIDDC